jgi:hypothetical protein
MVKTNKIKQRLKKAEKSGDQHEISRQTVNLLVKDMKKRKGMIVVTPKGESRGVYGQRTGAKIDNNKVIATVGTLRQASNAVDGYHRIDRAMGVKHTYSVVPHPFAKGYFIMIDVNKGEVTDKPRGYYRGGINFERPGSALRKATKWNPRTYPCPTCKKPNRLTLADVRKGYQCDECADRAEGSGCY